MSSYLLIEFSSLTPVVGLGPPNFSLVGAVDTGGAQASMNHSENVVKSPKHACFFFSLKQLHLFSKCSS